MMINDKVLNALTSASAHLENSILALNKRDESSCADSLWHVAAELEYALFLLSITSPDKGNSLSWKQKSQPKETETDLMLTEAKKLLNEARTLVVSEGLLDAYKSAYSAKCYVLKLQEGFAKKKREALRKK
jgi:hypothetical protein